MTTVRPLARWQIASGVLGVVLLAVGIYMGLGQAPPEKHMGDVSRILYVHVPSAWNSLLIYTIGAVFAAMSLWSSATKWDARMVGALETGCVLNVILLLTGMLWGRPTWGVWWDWDVRLTTSLISLILFAGVLALRSFIDDSERRATWSAVATVVAYVDVPLVYFCVRWFRSIHQVQSSPETIDSAMVLPLRINAFGVLFVAILFMALRSRIELARRVDEEVPEPARLETVTVRG